MNLTDLRDVLDERSATYDVEARSHLTLTGVQRRLVIRRRRRIAATAAAVVVVLAAGAGTLAVTRSSGRTPAVAPTVAMVHGFPAYAQGARVIAASEPDGMSAPLTFVPDSTNLVVFVHCDDDTKEYRILLNNHEAMGGKGCGSSFGINDTEPELGVRVGQPSTVTVRFPEGRISGFAVAVGAAVPVNEYVFPARPTPLKPLDVRDDLEALPDEGATTVAMVRADPINPARSMAEAFHWTGGRLHLLLRAQTPGKLRVALNGVTVREGDWWDYDQGLVDGGRNEDWSVKLPKPTVNAPVSILVTVTPERMTGDWAVALQADQP